MWVFCTDLTFWNEWFERVTWNGYIIIIGSYNVDKYYVLREDILLLIRYILMEVIELDLIYTRLAFMLSELDFGV